MLWGKRCSELTITKFALVHKLAIFLLINISEEKKSLKNKPVKTSKKQKDNDILIAKEIV